MWCLLSDHDANVVLAMQSEEDVDLQARSAKSIAAFIDICSAPGSAVRSNPSEKLVKNLCTFLCQDVSRTPIFAASKHLTKGILTLEYTPARGLATKEPAGAQVEHADTLTAKLVYRGAQLALSELAARFGADLLERVPKLWSCMSETLLAVYASGQCQPSPIQISKCSLLEPFRRHRPRRQDARGGRRARAGPPRLPDGAPHRRAEAR